MDDVALYSYRRDGNFLGNFGPVARAYRHEWREGPYTASWRFEADNDPTTEDDLVHFFNTRFMTRVSARFDGSEVWRGYVGKLTLTVGGLQLTKDIGKLSNAVKCSYRYTDSDGLSATAYTSWHINKESLAQYGSFEEVLSYNGTADAVVIDADTGEILRGDDNAPITEPDDRAAYQVARYATPFTQQISQGKEDATLECVAYGAMVLADRILLSDGPLAYRVAVLPWEMDEIDSVNTYRLRAVSPTSEFYEAYSYGDAIAVSDEIRRIIAVVNYQAELYGVEPLLYARNIVHNDRQTAAGVARPAGAVSRLLELGTLRDRNEDYYSLSIDIDGAVDYAPLDKTPKYKFYPPPAGIKIVNSDKSPTWAARPGIISITGDYVEHLPQTWLGDGSLIWPERVAMRAGADVAEFGAAEYTPATFRSALEANKRRIKAEKRRRKR